MASIQAKVLHFIRRFRWQLMALSIWLLLLLAANGFMQSRGLSVTEFAQELGDLLTGTWYGPVIYIVVYILRPVILLPASILTLMAGAVFGLPLGFLYALLGGTASSLLPYGVARWFSTEAGDMTKADSRISRFIGLMRDNPFQAVLLMRLLYLPYDVVSLLAGSLGLPLGAFFMATAIGNIGGSLAYVGVGSSLEGDLTTGDISIDPAILAFSFAILLISLAASRYLNQRQRPIDTKQTG